MMKRWIALLLGIAMAVSLTVVPASAAGTYQDIPADSSLAGDILKGADYGLMDGYDGDTVGYADSMTRAQFVGVLYRMMREQWGSRVTAPTAPSFTDVPATHTWYTQIEAAVQMDVLDAGGAFRPNAAITRGEMAEMLVRALGLRGAAELCEKKAALPFTDVTERKGYITVAYDIGMTKGTSATTFGPNLTATRGQAAAMLARIYEKLSQRATWTHGFYAISSYSQLDLTDRMEAVSAGWSRMTWDGSKALLATTGANGNEFAVPDGYEEVAERLADSDIPLNLNVFMDTSGGVSTLLASESGRAQAVEQILSELTVVYEAYGDNPYSGVTIDFECLRASDKQNFDAFLTELSVKVHDLDKTLYVCVSPVLSTGGYYDGYNYSRIAAVADKVILMAYDYEPKSLAGYEGTEYYKTAAQAPLDQIYWSLRTMVEQVGEAQASKIVLGFSCENVAWKIDGSGKLLDADPVYPTNDTVWKRLQQPDTVTGWSDTYQMSYATYTTEDGSRYFLWYQSSDSVQAAANMASLLGVTGVSIWRIGNIPMYDTWHWAALLNP